MRTWLKRRLTIIAVALVLPGCSVFPAPISKERQLYMLSERSCDRNGELQGTPSVVVERLLSDPLLSSNKIVFSPTPTQRSFYRYSFWAVPPTEQLTKLLIRELECSGGSPHATRSAESAPRAPQLRGEVESFLHSASSEPGLAIVRIRVELLQPGSDAAAQIRVFEHRTPAKQFNAAGAVEALDESSHEVVSAIARWVAEAGAHTAPLG